MVWRDAPRRLSTGICRADIDEFSDIEIANEVENITSSLQIDFDKLR